MEAYYDISNDLKDVWDADIDPEMRSAVLEAQDSLSDWAVRDKGVVLHDRLMTDAALGHAPIKTEHSYSLSDDSADSSPHHGKVDDMEDECYPTIPASAWSRRRRPSSPGVKAEPKSEPSSPASSCPPSPAPSTPHLDYVIDHTTGTIHMPGGAVAGGALPRLLLGARATTLAVKVTSSSSSSGFSLPPTPPSSLSSSDSEGALSPARDPAPPAPPAAPARRHHLYAAHHSSRQPINTPLISSQPKGSTGSLLLTAEETRTLLAEGYPVPTRLPLTKQEEKALKKIRRKIKNKISAQESRRKKKEYMDQLERKVELLLAENCDYRQRVEALEQSNARLLGQLASAQARARH
ncbi:hypothetical protein JYU34_009321 [Plutella xylostella]|uniref:BZIP domain-containing protein n=1 Tax=Plutella xylostella TaxID=51655 RepID=A0ABQ7QJ66_PLUXY|nr:cyclic AMP response element-binding protein A [Plutella xylostella]KAG7305278.1 hypothetical protein JYU34_009321 [Plutella xylostella]